MKVIGLLLVLNATGLTCPHAFGDEVRKDVMVGSDTNNHEPSAAQNLVFECLYQYPRRWVKLKGVEHLTFQTDPATGHLKAAGTCVFETTDAFGHE